MEVPEIPIDFFFMDGLGNDFVILDMRGKRGVTLSPEQVRYLSARTHADGGCDQLIVMEDAPLSSPSPGCFIRIYNADGSEVNACGNATRCVADILLKEVAVPLVTITTKAGLLQASHHPNGITVDMGAPNLNWQSIPLGWESDLLNLSVNVDMLKGGVAVSMGNPHVVFFLDEAIDTLELASVAPLIQQWQQNGMALFPEGVNVGVANIISDSELNLRVYERGVGETLACGTGACAAAVAAIRLGRTARDVTIHTRGGDLHINWPENGAVLMSGPVHLCKQKTATLQEMLA